MDSGRNILILRLSASDFRKLMGQDETALMPDSSPFWAPHVHADRRAGLLGRARITAALRELFAGEGFIEVETSTLVPSPGNETHLHAFATDLLAPGGARERRYLRTSPEFACKTILAAGEPRIVEFARVFRNRERGALHHPEFTLLEWYRAREPYTTLMADCAAILRLAAEAAGRRNWSFRRRTADPLAPPERLTVAEAFARHAGIDLLAVLPASDAESSGSPGSGGWSGSSEAASPNEACSPDEGKRNPGPPERRGEFSRARFAASAEAAGVRVAADDTWADIFSRVLVEKVEPHLGCGRATILDEYPVVMSALARPKPSNPRVAERFELYVCGVELANGFGELNDAAEQRRRLEIEMAEKQRIYGERYPIDENFIAALAVMPPASGIALGLDRLVMLATGATHIEQVIWTPVAQP